MFLGNFQTKKKTLDTPLAIKRFLLTDIEHSVGGFATVRLHRVFGVGAHAAAPVLEVLLLCVGAAFVDERIIDLFD